MAPAGTPRDIIDKLARAVNEAIKSGGGDRSAARAGHRAHRRSPEDLARVIANEIKRWTTVATAAGLKK